MLKERRYPYLLEIGKAANERMDILMPQLMKAAGLANNCEAQNHIAKTAGITPAGVYRHFPSKEAMFESLVQPMLDEFEKICRCSMEETLHALDNDDFLKKESSTKDLLKELDRRGIGHEKISDEEWHIISTTYVSAVCEVIRHEFPREKAHSYMHFIGRFFYPGWKALLGVIE